MNNTLLLLLVGAGGAFLWYKNKAKQLAPAPPTFGPGARATKCPIGFAWARYAGKCVPSGSDILMQRC